jgi:hypothetical protein
MNKSEYEVERRKLYIERFVRLERQMEWRTDEGYDKSS